MELHRLLPALDPAPPAIDVADLTVHSAEVVPGGLFLACAGARSHGLHHALDAIRHGARAIAWEPSGTVQAPSLPEGVASVAVPHLRERLGAIANEFFAQPSEQLRVTGITGTNGKTTVAWLLAQALERLGRRAGYMGTLGFGLGGDIRADAFTTPDCITVHRRLRELLDRQASDVAMEVSSHALDQGRIDGVRFHIAAFTNLSQDHLDYHGDLDAYGTAKMRLFLQHRPDTAVINIGDAFGRALVARLPREMRTITVAAATGPSNVPDADLLLRRLAESPSGQRIDMLSGQQPGPTASVQFVTTLPGAFNVENLAVVAGILVAEGFALADVGAALAECSSPPGRMEVIGGAPRVVVDFAHTPDALRRVLQTLRADAAGELWCVFGCGGERDAGKRPLMGAIAREFAAHVVITDDNPRGEDADAIVAAILEGCGRGAGVEVMRDRASAIRHAIASAAPADTVLIAGKGHESVQIVGGVTRPFSDQAEARDVLAARS